MREPRKWVPLGILVLTIAAGVAVFAATTLAGSHTSLAGKPIVIGYSADLVGRMSPFDTPALTAAKLEAKRLNAKGGILGHKLVIKVCNTQDSKPDVAKSCAANLIGQGAVIGLVTCDVDFATPAAQEFLNKGELTIAPCIGTDQMGPKRFGSKGKLAFSVGNVAQDEGAAMAEYAISKGWKKAITVTDNLLVYFRNIVQAFTVRYKELGGTIVDAESFTSFDKTIGNVVSRVNQQKADVIATSTGFADWPAFVSGLRSLNNSTPIMNSWAGDGTFWYPKNPPVTHYWYVTYASVFGDDPDPAVRALIAKMKAIGQPPATGGFVTGAAAIDAIAAAITQAKGSTNGKTLAAIFVKFHGLPTISGKISYSPALHSVFGRAYRVMEVENNTPKFVKLLTTKKLAKIG
jgi:branched-chain amino acid transport system substrate-binding protein